MIDVPVRHATPPRTAALAELFRVQRPRLWGLAVRLTGCAEDADDIVQESFARLSAQRPRPDDARVGSWLACVATNLAIDALRRRRRRAYVGPWLPAPIADEILSGIPDDASDVEARYGLAESTTYAFLLALEVLGPRQRAVLVLRDVLGRTARETAETIGTSEGNVRVLHTRARAALATYDAARCIPTAELRERHREVLQRWMACLFARDVAGIEALLAESVHTVTDAAGEFTALASPMSGRRRVARFYLVAAQNRAEGGPSMEMIAVNGLPAVAITLAHPKRRQAPRTIMRIEIDADGRIRAIHSIMAAAKLRTCNVRPART